VSEVFISYSRQDGNHVDLLTRKLEDAGHKVWLDRSAIEGGARWQEEIVRSIEKANAGSGLSEPVKSCNLIVNLVFEMLPSAVLGWT
jgi:hypothetical protein